MEVNIAIIDDMYVDGLKLKTLIENYFFVSEHTLNELKIYLSGEELLKVFEPKMFQIIFMDIIMKELNGVETARQLRAEDTELLIIFVTTSREYVFDACHVHPFDYVIKPYSVKAIEKILGEALRVLTADDPTVTIEISHSEYKIPVRLINSAVSQGRTVEINLTDGKILLSNMKFREVEQRFSEHKNFLLCNRGIIVNMSQISAQEEGVFVMKNGTRCPIRVNGRSKVTAAFSQYIIENVRANIIPHASKLPRGRSKG